MQAIPSPRPIHPIPSLVVALTLTRAEVAWDTFIASAGAESAMLERGVSELRPEILAEQLASR